MSRRLKQMEAVEYTSSIDEYHYVFDGVKEASLNQASIHIPVAALAWKRCWIKVYINGRRDWYETHSMRTLNKRTYTYRRPDIPAGARVQILIQRSE